MLIEDADFTVFDFETTGLYPYNGDRICEIGALRFGIRSRKPHSFHRLVDPQRRISPGAFRVNGITDAMVRGKPLIGDVLPDFLKFVNGSILVAYNAPFDLGFLQAALGIDAVMLEDYYVIDALRLARRLYPGIGRYGLGSVTDYLGIAKGREHRAIADATMTWKVFKREIALIMSDGIKTVEDIERYRIVKSSAINITKDYRIEIMEDAIRRQRQVLIVYRSAWNSGTTNRIISPKELMLGHDHSYVKAYCHLRKEERTFRLDCMVEVSVV